MNRSYEQGKQKGMQDSKQDDPEIWCQTYTRKTDDESSRHQTRPREPRSKSHSPNRCPADSILNLTRRTDSPPYGASFQTMSPVVRNSDSAKHGDSFEIEDHLKRVDCKGQQHVYASNKQHDGMTEKRDHGSSGKRRKRRGKTQSHDRATMQFIRKLGADHKHVSEPNASGHFSCCGDLEASDHMDKTEENPNPELNATGSGKGTPVMACNIRQEAGGMLGHHPYCTSSSGACGLGPSLTHNAYVLHWLQQQTSHAQLCGRNLPHLQASPCRQSLHAPSSNGYYPVHSSPVHQLQPPHSGCTCTPGHHDVSNELMTMIQDTSQTPYLLQPPGDFQPMSCQDRQQIPIGPDAQSFLAMLQHKPDTAASPSSHHRTCTHAPSMEQPCHFVAGNAVHPCVSQNTQVCNSPQHTACPPFISPPRLRVCTQHHSPFSPQHPPNANQCSLEHAALFLNQSQLQDSPVRLNTSSLKAAYGSPIRQALGNSMVQNSPINSSQQVLEDSMLSAISSFYNGSADRSKCDDKSGADNPAPIGVFWDIENCAVPRGKSALAVVQCIRDRFFSNHREAEFMCVCDINKENGTVIQELNDAQVTVAHINATAKNAADDKLKQSLRRFADTHSPPATVVLISGDVNFARDLSDLRHRNNLRIILVHRDETSEALKACANEAVRYQDMVNELPFRSPAKTAVDSCTLIVHNLPCRKDPTQLRNRLKQLSENCGGKVIHMSYKNAVVQFPNAEKASRAKIRLDGENVYGNKISVAYPKNKLQPDNTNSPARGSSNKNSPQSLQDVNEDVTESQSTSKGDDEDELSDARDEGTEELDGEQEVGDQRSTTERRAAVKSCHPSSFSQSDYNSTDSPQPQRLDKPRLDEPQRLDEPASLNAASVNRIAAAFRPIQQDMKRSVDYNEDDKPVVEIWPNKYCIDGGILPPSHEPASTMSKMNWPTSVLYNQYHTHPTSTAQAPFNDDVRPGLLPFKPIPTVQRIPTPPPGQSIWNRVDHEQPSQSPTLRGVYRPPSPMLANPMGDWQYMSIQDTEGGVRKGAELLVTNLDNRMSRQDLKQCLLAKLTDHCKVLHLIFGSPVPGRYQAVVRVPSIPDAIRAMANINRCQIGTRILHVSLLLPSDSNADKLRLMIIPMLQEIPGMCLPLCDVKNSFERRYRQMLYVSDLYHIPDTITIRDAPMGKVVALTTQSRPGTPNSSGIHSPAGHQSPAPFFIPKEPTPEPCEPYCSIHDLQDNVEYRNITQDPFVIVSLRTFSAQVHTLLQMHNGRIPLISFMVCYAAEFLALTEDYDEGVSLEHLLTCIQGVRVGVSRDGYKTVCWEQTKPQTENQNGIRSATPLLPPQLFQFSKEAVELLKHTQRCRLAFSKFIPNYHHHFGRQCRVADYGFLKLIELFDAISHVLQVLGITENKLLTLTHRTQIKRFSQDLLKVLKSQASKQMTLQEFPVAYLRCFNKPWKVTDYGVCDIQDLLVEVPENMAMISWNGDDTVIFIPRREQTNDELICMRKFSREVVELLSHQPRYRILFSKFIPTFHHHFGHQCRVGDYGFNKLLELFEALQDVIQVEEQGDERVVTLATTEQLALIARRTSEMLQRNRLHLINLDVFHQMYIRCYMYPICLKDFGVKNMQELMAGFPHVVEVVSDGSAQRLHLIEKMHLSQLAQQVLVVLLETEEGQLPITDVPVAFQGVWHQDVVPIEYGHSRLLSLMKMLHYVLMVQNEWLDDCYVELTPVHQFARRARNVLVTDNRLSMTLQELVTKYHRLHGVELQPADYGHTTLTSLIDTVPRVLSIVSKGARRAVTLNPSCLVPGWSTDTGKTSSLRRLSDQRLSFNKVSPYESRDRKISTHSSDRPASSQSSVVSGEPSRPHSTQAVGSTRPSYAQCMSVPSSVDTPPISPDPTDLNIAPSPMTRPSSGTSHSDSREEYLTPPERTSSDGEGRTLNTPSDNSKTPRRSVVKNRGRCHLAANFSAKGSI